MRAPWTDFIQFDHGKCEDSGIGDLDNDGRPDYIANGGWIYFSPEPDKARDPANWIKMTLSDKERRVPIVIDLNGDGLEDLAIAGGEKGSLACHLIILLRKPGDGAPAWEVIVLPQPADSFPKGISIGKLIPDSARPEVLVIPKSGDLWTASYEGDPTKAASWITKTLPTPGSSTRKKMDNA